MKNLLLIFSVGFLFFLASCKPKQVETVECNNCENGYEQVMGECKCPDNKFEVYGFCRELREDEWYGTTDDCICQDTFFLRIEKIENGRAEIVLNQGVFRTYPESGWIYTNYHFEMDYFSLMDGDSIASRDMIFENMTCNTDVNIFPEYKIFIYGKLNLARDTLNMEFVYKTNPELEYVETCNVLFHQ